MSDIQSITDVSLQVPTLSETVRVVTFRGGYNTNVVLLGTAALGMAAGVIGTFLVLRRRALMSDALAHCALPGVAGAFLLSVFLGSPSRSTPLLLAGAALSGLLGIFSVQLLVRATRLHEDAAIGAVLSSFFALGVVLLSVVQTLNVPGGGLEHYLYGQTAAMRAADVWTIASIATTIVILVTVLFKELQIVCFDPAFAGSQGWPVSRIDLTLMVLVGLTTLIGIQSVGLILVVAFLLVPPVSARFWTDHLHLAVILSGVFGALSGFVGAAISSLLPRMPAGAVIVLTAGVLFIISMLVAPRRGLISRAVRHLSLRIRIFREHLLRALYEALEHRHLTVTTSESEAISEIKLLHGWRAIPWTIALRTVLRGAITERGARIAFTERGLQEATRLVQNHRLWEEYLHRFGGLSPSHVDYTADIVEHVSDRELLRELEEALLRRTSRTVKTPLPISPSLHEIAGTDATKGERV